MGTNLDELLSAAQRATMTREQQEEQRRSFAYGNTNIENGRVTREIIDEAARVLAEHDKG
jgi:hypothetical protein